MARLPLWREIGLLAFIVLLIGISFRTGIQNKQKDLSIVEQAQNGPLPLISHDSQKEDVLSIPKDRYADDKDTPANLSVRAAPPRPADFGNQVCKGQRLLGFVKHPQNAGAQSRSQWVRQSDLKASGWSIDGPNVVGFGDPSIKTLVGDAQAIQYNYRHTKEKGVSLWTGPWGTPVPPGNYPVKSDPANRVRLPSKPTTCIAHECWLQLDNVARKGRDHSHGGLRAAVDGAATQHSAAESRSGTDSQRPSSRSGPVVRRRLPLLARCHQRQSVPRTKEHHNQDHHNPGDHRHTQLRPVHQLCRLSRRPRAEMAQIQVDLSHDDRLRGVVVNAEHTRCLLIEDTAFG